MFVASGRYVGMGTAGDVVRRTTSRCSTAAAPTPAARTPWPARARATFKPLPAASDVAARLDPLRDDDVATRGFSGLRLFGGTHDALLVPDSAIASDQSNKIVTVNYATANGTAVAGGDYTTTDEVDRLLGAL